MTAPTMRRLALTFLALLGVLLAPVPTVSAQEPPVIRLTLLEQTPWNSSFDETNARELFVEQDYADAAYADQALPISCGRCKLIREPMSATSWTRY